MKSCKYKAGVTLIEMLIVVAVLSLLTSIFIAAAARIYNQSKEQLTKNTFALLDAALQEYYDDKHEFPPGVRGADPNVNSQTLYEALYSIVSSRKILGEVSDSLIKNQLDPANTAPELYDPWGTVLDYWYEPGRDTFPKLTSAGPDRQFGTPDDITNK